MTEDLAGLSVVVGVYRQPAVHTGDLGPRHRDGRTIPGLLTTRIKHRGRCSGPCGDLAARSVFGRRGIPAAGARLGRALVTSGGCGRAPAPLLRLLARRLLGRALLLLLFAVTVAGTTRVGPPEGRASQVDHKRQQRQTYEGREDPTPRWAAPAAAVFRVSRRRAFVTYPSGVRWTGTLITLHQDLPPQGYC